jgi:hypothetical protein
VLCSVSNNDITGIGAGTANAEGGNSSRDSSDRDSNLLSYNGSMASDAMLQPAASDAELLLYDVQRFFTNIFSPPSTPVPIPHSPRTDG